MDLFQEQRKQSHKAVEPLAVRMRPRVLEEFVGQEHFLGEGKLLRRMLLADRLGSMIFYGPPGTGKTTLAHVIAHHTQAEFVEVNAAGVGVKEIREIIDQAKTRLETSGGRTILFIDEIHRFTKAQQDVLLNDVEKGIIILIGSTTENPFFSVNSPLISRSQIFQFEPLAEAHIVSLLHRALQDVERGLGRYSIRAAPEALAHLAKRCDGDARRALTGLEVAVLSQIAVKDSPAKAKDKAMVVDLATVEESIQQKAIVYDRQGDAHYDAASAFIKSMRGSDPDAAVYWLAKMLEAGEDPRFIARRIAILASEDIGNADPMALVVANAAFQVTLQIGLPECRLTLAQAVVYMACAPKSNASAMAIWSAGSDIKENRTIPVPKHLRDANYRGAKQLGHGKGYEYPHEAPGAYLDQDYLGVDRQYYIPTDRGYEKTMGDYLSRIRGPSEEPET